MKLTELSAADMRRAADLKDKIDACQQELLNIFGMADQPEPQVEFNTPMPKRRRMSAASRAKIADAARRRWAKVRAAGRNSL